MHWVIAKNESLVDCPGEEDGWEWFYDEQDHKNARALIEKHTYWNFRLSTWRAVVRFWHQKIFAVLDKVKLLKSKWLVTFEDGGEVVPEVSLFKRLLSRKQFKVSIVYQQIKND